MRTSRRRPPSLLRAIRLLLRKPEAALLAVRLAWWVALVTVLARLLPLPRALALTSPRVRTGVACDAVHMFRLARVLDALLRLGVMPYTPSCWKRSAVLHRFLALHGVATRIVFGVRVDGRTFAAHAWLENDGQPCLEHGQSTSRHTRLYVFEPQ